MAISPRILAAFLFLLPLKAHAAQPVIDSFTLKNGMEVIVVENHRVPAVSHMLWFRVGAIDDPPGQSGLAHFHEHLMFKGSAHYKAGEYADIIARNGGQQNAFTGHDATAYYANIAKENLPRVMELEADRLRGLTPEDAEALKEREVILEERRSRTDNNPAALFSEQLNAALYLHHPYRLPVIGWKHEMETLTKDEVVDFHRRYYHPGNATLIVSGDITAAELKPLAEKYYADIPAGPKAARRWNREPPHLAARRLSMTHPNVEHALLVRSYLAASVNEGRKELVPALSVLEQVLGGGKSSRLYQSLVVKQKIAAGTDADYNGFALGPADFALTVTPADGIAPDAVEQAMDAELARVVQGGVTEEELRRAKTLLKAESLYAREGLQSIAYILGWLRMVGLDTAYFLQWPEMIEAVTAQQVRQAAADTFDPKRSVTGILLPERKEAKGAADAKR